MTGWQWHQLDHTQISCTLLQTDNHTSTSPLTVFTGRMPFQPPNQQRQGSVQLLRYIPCNQITLNFFSSDLLRNLDAVQVLQHRQLRHSG